MAVSEALRAEYAPTGVLRVALNHGNRVLVGRDAEGRTQGISVDLARALAADLGLPAGFVEYERAIDVSAVASEDVWDVCFLAVDPERATTIQFTRPYVRIEGCYLVAPAADVPDAPALVAGGHGVGAVDGSAYTLHLKRQPGAEKFLRIFADIKAALAAMDGGAVAGIAGIRQAMATEAALRFGARVLEPPFMEIRQAMGLPTGRPRAAAHLSAFLEGMGRSGAVGAILERHGVAADCAMIANA